MNNFTNWAEAYPIKDHKANMVAKLLSENSFCRLGMPEELLSDQGPEFKEELFVKLCKAFGIEKIRTSQTGYPQMGHWNVFTEPNAGQGCHWKPAWLGLACPAGDGCLSGVGACSVCYTPKYLMLGRSAKATWFDSWCVDWGSCLCSSENEFALAVREGRGFAWYMRSHESTFRWMQFIGKRYMPGRWLRSFIWWLGMVLLPVALCWQVAKWPKMYVGPMLVTAKPYIIAHKSIARISRSPPPYFYRRFKKNARPSYKSTPFFQV